MRLAKSARGLAQSKTCRRFGGLLFLSAFSFQLSAFSQSCSLDGSTIDGGGDTSTGGPMIGNIYFVTGTIGQPEDRRIDL